CRSGRSPTAPPSQRTTLELGEQPHVCAGGPQELDRGRAAREAVHDELQVVLLAFNRDAPEPLKNARLSGSAAARERLEDHPAGWGDEPHEPTHEVERLHSRVQDPPVAGTLSLAGLRVVVKHRE